MVTARQLRFDGGWSATVTDEPLRLVPRFEGRTVRVMPWVDVTEREEFLLHTFGSQERLWDTPDVLRFTPAGRELSGAEFHVPEESAYAGDRARVPLRPAVRPGGLRADEARDFRHEVTSVHCRASGDTVLTCLRDLDVLDEPLDARIGIAQDLALLVQHGTVVGWSLSDPARYVTTPDAVPDPAPPTAAVRRLFTECLDLITQPLILDVEDREPAALERLRAADQALRDQREDRHRADALRTFISQLVKDCIETPARRQP
ncbi:MULTISPECIES: hypothetical protein [unclassified Streptomyces]|uniref:hypothetical protein n=1 Tax=unclassified Streptomyces TaxID=2593676 RepID=UPI000DAD2B4A|nr:MULTISPECIES: hypothetical protein [unclassified Streptomyces]PZT74759.1 hypothetical protein DNK55_22100 [Streptomyces sp. AC1-42T]PZT82255.1 hypothetical protein DNK56_09345 [Streptomyces sp. AC1-42W]